MPQLTVSKLGGRVGVSPDTIRYYERAGLLPAPERTPAGYRLYDEQVAERLHFIKGAQRVGLRLREIRELLEVLDRGLCPCGHVEALVRGRIAEIEGEIARLRQLKRELESLLARYPAEACAADGARWACETELIRAGEEARDGSS